jgi:hypothetical protein
MKEASEFLQGGDLRRIFLPGAVVVLYIHPYLRSWLLPLSTRYFDLEAGLVLLAEALLFGLLISSAMLPIFYLYEGHQSAWLTWPASRFNRWKKQRIRSKLKSLYAGRKYDDFTDFEKTRANRLYARLRDFPVERKNGRPEFVVDRPTRLGNIIASYEHYPRTRYGIDGLTFWSHLLVLAPEPAREGYEEAVAFADSMVLTSASGAMVAVAALCALCSRAVGVLSPSAAALLRVSTPPIVDWLGLAGGLAVWLSFYQLALPAHRKVRRAFQALTDLAVPTFVAWVMSVDIPLRTDVAAKADEVSAYLTVLKEPDAGAMPSSAPAPPVHYS